MRKIIRMGAVSSKMKYVEQNFEFERSKASLDIWRLIGEAKSLPKHYAMKLSGVPLSSFLGIVDSCANHNIRVLKDAYENIYLWRC